MSDVRLDAIWEAIRARISVARLDEVLYGTRTLPDGTIVSRVYRVTEDYSASEDDNGLPWGRVVLVPANTMWDPIDVPGQSRKVNFLTRVEFNNFTSDGYDVNADFEAVHEVLRDRLDGWLVTGLPSVQMVFNVYRRTYPQPTPFYDDSQKLWWNSAEYRFEAAKLTPA